MLEIQFTLLVVIMVLFVVGVVASVIWVERKHTKKELSDWYNTPANDEDIALLGVVAPKKKKGDK